MRWPAATKGAPTFTTLVTADVDVDIGPEELEEAGWVYVGGGSNTVPDEKAIDAVIRWHEREHDLPWRWCTHALCKELNVNEESP